MSTDRHDLGFGTEAPEHLKRLQRPQLDPIAGDEHLVPV